MLTEHEVVEVLCHDDAVREDARAKPAAHHVRMECVRLRVVPNNRVWLRDSAPTAVHDEAGRVVLLDWRFNAWAKYDNYALREAAG